LVKEAPSGARTLGPRTGAVVFLVPENPSRALWGVC
jgi:hypothetical protein